MMFERDDGLVRPLVSKERLEAVFDMTLIILGLIIGPYLLYNLVKGFIKISYYFMLVPDIEISLIVIIFGIIALYFGKYCLDEFIEQLTKKFDDLKQKNTELFERNAELSKRNAELTKRNSELTKKNAVLTLEKLNEISSSEAELILSEYYD